MEGRERKREREEQELSRKEASIVPSRPGRRHVAREG